MKDITVILRDSPGTLADLCEILAAEGINIEGISVVTYKGECPIHILVEDSEAAVSTLEAHWMEVIDERDVLIKQLPNEPGALGLFTRQLADAGINIEVTYPMANGELAIVVDDLDKAKQILQ